MPTIKHQSGVRGPSGVSVWVGVWAVRPAGLLSDIHAGINPLLLHAPLALQTVGHPAALARCIQAGLFRSHPRKLLGCQLLFWLSQGLPTWQEPGGTEICPFL